MKALLIPCSILLLSAMAMPMKAADATAKITDVHLCCKGCVNGVEKAVNEVDGAKASIDADAGTVTLTGPDSATIQKAADSMVKAGYFGKSDGGVNLDSSTGAADQKVQSLRIEGAHLCCGKCVKAVDRAVKAVPGAKEHTAVKGAKTFEVTGDFNDKELLAALQKEGLTGKVAK
jgi:copper chaperone CopZ